MRQTNRTVLESPSHVARLAGTFHDVTAGKHSPENFNCRLKRGIREITRSVRFAQKRTFSKKVGSISLQKSQNRRCFPER